MKLLSLLFAATAGAAAAQSPPWIYHRSVAQGYFDIYNGTAMFNASDSRTTSFVRSGYGMAAGGSGTASTPAFLYDSPGRLEQMVKVTLHGHTDYGRITFYGQASARNSGTVSTNGSGGTPALAYLTKRVEVQGYCDLGYSDVLHVESALPAGTPVTLRFRIGMHHFQSLTVTSPEKVTLPPAGPGGQSTITEELRSTTDTGPPGSGTNTVRITSWRLNGTALLDSPGDYRIPGDREFDFPALAGGTVNILHNFSAPAVSAVTRNPTATHRGDVSAEKAYSYSSYVQCWPVTSGVSLRSSSGASYKPPTGQAAILQVSSTPQSLLLTAPDGVIFQRGVRTPQGLAWEDLPDTRLLHVPFTGSSGFFRARQP